MNLKQAFLLSLVLIYTTSAVHSLDQCCDKCLKGIQKLDLGELDTYTKPLAPNLEDDFKFCKRPFELYGTCCDSGDLEKIAVAWTKQMKETVQKNIDELPTLVEGLDEIDKVIAFIKLNRQLIITKDIMNGVINTSLINSWLAVLDKIAEWNEDKQAFKHKLITIQSSVNLCYETLMTQRINGLCLRCSSTAANVFSNTQNSYKIDYYNCKLLALECGDYLSLNSEIIAYYQILREIRRAYGSNVGKVVPSRFLSLETLKTLRDCAQGKKSCLENSATNYVLCSQISLSQENYLLEGHPEILSHGYKALKNIIKEMDPGSPKFDDDNNLIPNTPAVEDPTTDNRGLILPDNLNGINLMSKYPYGNITLDSYIEVFRASERLNVGLTLILVFLSIYLK